MSRLNPVVIAILNAHLDALQGAFASYGFEANIVLLHKDLGTCLFAGVSNADDIGPALDKTKAEPDGFEGFSRGGSELHVWPKEQQS